MLALPLVAGCRGSGAIESAAAPPRPSINAPLAGFKDRRFAYRAPLESRDSGDFLRVPYDETLDINKRDEIPVRKVRGGYIRRIPAREVRDFTYTAGGRTLAVYGLGRLEQNAAMTVIYLHGKGGNREWGFDDERFGGNYNRLKNLMLENGGAYLSPDFTDFETAGAEDIAALIARQRPATAGALILACGSLGTQICWRLANNPKTAAQLDGLVLLGGFPNQSFLDAVRAGRPRPPLYIAHGSADNVYPAAAMIGFYEALRATGHPVRITIFETGNHGTPVRMIDWRQALNWLASR